MGPGSLKCNWPKEATNVTYFVFFNPVSLDGGYIQLSIKGPIDAY